MKKIQIRTCTDRKPTKKEYVLKLFTYGLLMAGSMKVICSGFPELMSVWWIYTVLGILAGGVLLLIPEGKIRELLLPVGLGIFLILLFMGFSYSKNGLSVLGNEFLTFLTGKTGRIYLDFPTEGTSGVYYVAALFCTLFSLLLAELIYRKNPFWGYLLAAFCLIGCAVGFFSSDYGICLMLGGLLCMIFLNHMKVSERKGLVRLFLTYGGILTICGIIAFFVVSAAGGHFSTKHIRRTVEEELHQAQYDTGTNAMPEGNLRNLDYFRKSEEAALTISAKEPQKFYLRGLTGEIYTGNAWEGLSDEAYEEGEDLFYWLHKNGLTGETTIASAVALTDNGQPYQLKVTNISACREHQYLPYGLSDLSVLNLEKIDDGMAKYPGHEIRYEYYSGSLPQWYEAYMYLSGHGSQREVQEYLALEQSYREYVYKNDLQLTNTAAGVFERLFGTEKKERALSEILQIVKNTLDQNLEYKENVTTSNGENDFLKYTLEQSKKGYSVHYATAATLMLRYFGIPARYVEGYYLSAEEAEKYASMEEITITEAHAHAWTEFYLDGIGWIPFEVTPGYIDEEELKAAEQMVADGLGEGAGKSYIGSSKTYTPPKKSEEEQRVTDLNSLFRFEIRHVLWFLLIVLLILLIAAVWKLFQRRRRLAVFLKEMKEAEHREAITGLFAYSMMLQETCKVKAEGMEEMKAINIEALFSCHEMQLSQRERMEAFTEKMVAECKVKLSVWEKLRYHYILWLYR